MYSQNNEEVTILDYFKDLPKGRFLDIGAYDGVNFSNTRQLALNGWEGVLIDASPMVFSELMKNCKDMPNLKLYCMAIGLECGYVTFWDSLGDAVGTTDVAHMEKWSKYIPEWQEIHMCQESLKSLAREIGYDFDLISIDIEGPTAPLAMNLPEDMLKRCTCLVVEHDNKQLEIEAHVSQYGFKRLSVTSENIILAK